MEMREEHPLRGAHGWPSRTKLQKNQIEGKVDARASWGAAVPRAYMIAVD